MKTFVKRDLPFVLFLGLAVALLLLSSANVTRSAQRYESDLYKAEVEASNIGVTLMENGTAISWRDNALTTANGKEDNTWNIGSGKGKLLNHMASDDQGVEIGVAYPEALAVKNSGEIPEYCRLVIRRYWTKNGVKLQEKNPDYIKFEFANTDKWVRDYSWSDSNDTSEHPETIVLYYTDILPAGATTPPATKTLTVEQMTAGKVTETRTETSPGHWLITTVYDYDGLNFVVEAEADAVQTHNAKDAMISAWGSVPSVMQPYVK
ncbi:MAG: hypothetical protein Q4F31_06980 [Eubacteriales bacterium]|nr:hypothetical protein [Eubacteriales bacterium]